MLASRTAMRAFKRLNSTLKTPTPNPLSFSVADGESGSKNISMLDSKDVPLPKSVQAVYFQPLKLPIQHGDLVADLQLRSYGKDNLDFFANFILRVGYYLGMPMTGPKPLPTRRERWTVIRSPFAQAKSKENFERHTHKRLIRVWDTNPEIVELWLSYITKHSIAGVGMKCNVFQRSTIEADHSIEDIDLPVLDEIKSMDEMVGAKIVDLLNNPEFKKHL
ncbi:mitochondrial 37S ribosomal protein uS10m Ecym_2659 [Eremothecium cymbalariae DBVPG|uniref:Small ribosomal subunit protein uS10m n=1 Tax=Eremothecium cymbalariae (strain CBS 270.75 / DBVPG 7215 / KCTC 17166 / NRRL Y-17582) TaxID=931890 RepID=G8JNU5_ERECY|nr:Hypothetical protein Ecym_2659 [Eremothecium cymbalariae DBVPG\